MKITNLKKLASKKMIVFDLDGTLAKSKSVIDSEMVGLLEQLLGIKKVAVIGGGKYDLFKNQLIKQLKIEKKLFKNLYLFPTTATSFYKYDSGWKNVYKYELTPQERSVIKKTFEQVFQELKYAHPKKTYGAIIEDRKSQVTFSALGQEVVAVLGEKGLQLKKDWRNKFDDLRMQMVKLMQKYLPNLEVRAGGESSVDVTRKGIDKGYGLKQIEQILKVKISDMLFIGDAIFKGGNDFAITKTRVDYIKVESPEDTKKVIQFLI